MMDHAGKVLMLVESSIPPDIRIINESSTLHKAGYKVTIISLKKKGQLSKEIMNGVTIYRIPKINLLTC